MRHILKGLKWLAYGLLVVLVLVIGVLAFVATTETGLRWAWSAGSGYLPEGIEVESVEGRLIGPLNVHGLAVDLESMRLRLNHFALRWDAAALFSGVVHVRKIGLEGLEYTALPGGEEPPEPAEPFEMPESIDLPVDVVLEAFSLDDARVRTSPDAEPFVVDRARLAATLDDQSWRIGTLEASGPLFEVDGGAELTPSGAYANSARIDWRVNPPDLAPAEGETRLDGDLDNLEVTQQVAAPYNLQARATVRDPLESLAVEADVQLDQTRLAAIREDLPTVTVSTQADVEGTLADLGFTADVTASEPQQGTAQLDLAGRYTGSAVQIETLTLTSPDSPGRLDARGDIALAAGNRMDLVLEWQKLQWPLTGPVEYASPEGRVTVTGPLDGYRVDGGLRWRLAGQDEEGRLELAGNGSLKAFELETLALSGAPGRLTGHADIAWAPELDVAAQVSGENLNPGAVAPDWPGDFDLVLKLNAKQRDDGLYARLQRLRADGTLRGQPLNVDAAAKYSPAGAVIEKLRLLAGETELRASGQVTEPMNVEFTLNSDDLGTTLPGAEGTIEASGRARGAYLEPDVVAELDARGLAYGGNRIDRIDLEADVDLSANRRSTLNLTASDGRFGAMVLREASIRGLGTPRDHELSLAADTSEGRADLGLTGDFNQNEGAWEFRLQQAVLAYRELAPWRLAAPAAGRVTAAAQRLEQTCWTSEGARLCLQGANDGEGSRGQFSLEDFRFAYLKPLMPEDLEVEGSVSAEGRASLPAGGAPDAEMSVTTSEGRLSAVNPKGETVEVLAFRPGRIDASLAEDGGMQARVDLPLANGGIRLDADVGAAEAGSTARPLTGELSLNLDNLAFLPKLVPEVTEASGSMNGNYRFSGTLAAPELDGRLALDASALGLATPGLQIRDLSLAVVGAGRNIDIRASAKSGGGNLNARGSVALADAGPEVDVNVSGKSFQVLNNALGQVYASPDLTVTVGAERIDVSGELGIPEATITPRDLPAGGGVTVSGDQVIVRPGQEGAGDVDVGGRELHARVRVTVGDPDLRMTEFARRGRNYADTVRRLPGDLVRFEGFGMQAVLAGNLLIVQEPDEPATGSGELRIVVGQYKAYGQDLSIEDGQVLFGGGPVTQPALNVRAVRRPREDILVGVRVSGRLEQPDFSLFSEPGGMTQSEQLSWLILGQPLSGASEGESSLITKAALAIGLKGGNSVTEDLRGTLGVDEFGIESEGSGSAEQVSLVVGKYLTPKLYVSYGVGLFNPVNTLRLRYTLSKLWRLETQSSGTATGGDIIFSIERP